jgi:hypothetical protein
MNVQLPLHMDKPAFLEWVQRQEGRYELADGRVVVMVGASRAHGAIVRNLVLILCGQLDPREWEVIAEFGLDGTKNAALSGYRGRPRGRPGR